MTKIVYTSQLGWCIPLQIEDSKHDLLTPDDLRHLERYVPPAAVVEDSPVEDIPMAPVDAFNPPQWPTPANPQWPTPAANDRPKAGPGPVIHDRAAVKVEPMVVGIKPDLTAEWSIRYHVKHAGDALYEDAKSSVYFSRGEIAALERANPGDPPEMTKAIRAAAALKRDFAVGIANIARGGSITACKPRKRGLLAWLGL